MPRDADPTSPLSVADFALLVSELAGLPIHEYERARTVAAKKAGCRVTALDDLVEQARRSGVRASNSTSGNAAIATVVERFNQRYMVVNEAGKAMIYERKYDPVLRRQHFDRLTFSDLRQLYMNDLVRVGTDGSGRPVLKTTASIWLGHEHRRQFIHGVQFDPSGKVPPDGVLNLWEGFAVRAAPGDWTLLREHIHMIICGGNDEHFNYAMGWSARMVQHPDKSGEVAIVMKGPEGSGKGTWARALKHIMGQHGLQISNVKHLVGSFNAHLRDTVFLFADEAFFAGDRSHVGPLKALITEPHIMIEGKNQNAVQMPNYLHIMMASNEDWVVPAAIDARRFFVPVGSGAGVGNHAYFAAIVAQLEAGGYEAMLHDLLAYDLTGFNVRAVPATEGLQQQQKLSLGTTDAWWRDCLERGYVFKSRLGLESIMGVWQERVTTELLFVSYIEFAKTAGERHLLFRESLGSYMVSRKAKACRWRGAVTGEHVVDVDNPHGGTSRKAAPILQERACGYRVGTLHQARAAFTAATGLTFTWDGGETDDDETDVT